MKKVHLRLYPNVNAVYAVLFKLSAKTSCLDGIMFMFSFHFSLSHARRGDFSSDHLAQFLLLILLTCHREYENLLVKNSSC